MRVTRVSLQQTEHLAPDEAHDGPRQGVTKYKTASIAGAEAAGEWVDHVGTKRAAVAIMPNLTDTPPESNAQPEGPVARMIAEGGVAAEASGTSVGPTPVAQSEERPTDYAMAESDARDDGDNSFRRSSPWSSPMNRRLNRWWTKMAYRAIDRFGESSSEGSTDVLEKAFRRARLAEDLLDDFKQGTYSQISKRSVAVMGSGLALASKYGKPSVPAVTRLGSACLSMLVTEISKDDLRRYCRFKNYELQYYFG